MTVYRAGRICAAATALFATLALAPSSATADTMPTTLASYWAANLQAEFVFYGDAWGDIICAEHTSAGWSDPFAVWYGGNYSYAPGGALVAFYDGADGHLVFKALNNGGDIVEVTWNTTSYLYYSDLTIAVGGQRPWGHPYQYYSCPAGGYACSYVAGYWNSPTLVGFGDSTDLHQWISYPNGSDGHQHAMWYDGTSWHDKALSSGSNDPDQNQTSNEVGVAGLWDGAIPHVYYVGIDKQFHQWYYNGNWWDSPLPLNASGLPNFSAISASTTGNHAQSVFGSNTADVVGYWVNNGSWQNYAYGGRANYQPSCPTVAYSANGVQQFFYVGTDQHIYDGWNNYDITSVTPGSVPAALSQLPGPAAASGTPSPLSQITGFWDGTYRHIFYVGSDDEVHEFWAQGTTGQSWFTGNLGGYGAAYPPAY